MDRVLGFLIEGGLDKKIGRNRTIEEHYSGIYGSQKQQHAQSQEFLTTDEEH